ncbi:hypothetical protein [Candidatus Cardinium hertigii]|nr:hypothetical protein [Candidatus Cardinium hertigii]
MALFPLLFAGECEGGKSPRQPSSKDELARNLKDTNGKPASASESKTEASIKSLSQVKTGTEPIAEKDKATKSFIDKWYQDTIEPVVSDFISLLEKHSEKCKKLIEIQLQSETISEEELSNMESEVCAFLLKLEQAQELFDNDIPELAGALIDIDIIDIDIQIDIIKSTSKEFQQRLNDLKRETSRDNNKRTKYISYLLSIQSEFLQSMFNKLLKQQLPTLLTTNLLKVEKEKGLEGLKAEMKSIENDLKEMGNKKFQLTNNLINYLL